MSELNEDTTLKLMDEGFRDRLRRVVSGLRAAKGSGANKYAKFELVRLLGAPALTLMLGALVVIGLFAFAVGQAISKDREIEVDVITPETVQLDEIKEEIAKIDDMNEPPPDVNIPSDAPSVSDSPVDAPNAQVSDVASVAPVMTKSPLIMKGLYGTLANRGGAARSGALRAYGGSGVGEDSVLRALRWLKTNQDPNGSWAKVDKTDPVAMAGLALLCFLAHNETPSSPEFGPTVEKAMKFLVGSQAQNGVFGREYTHGIVTYAMSEGYALTKIMALKDAMDRGIDFIIKGQQPQGGYNYGFGKVDRFDLSVAGWQFQALKAAKMAGCSHEGLHDAIKKGIDFLKKQAYDPTKGGFVYDGKPGIQANGGSRPSMTSAGVLCLQLLGQPNVAEVRTGLEFIKEMQCKWDSTLPDKNAKSQAGKNAVYTWYYATQAKFQKGGADWESWNKQFARQVIFGQQKDGHWEGGDHGGSVYTTTLCVLMLEVYYRYLPTYKQVEQVEEVKPASSDDVKVEVG
ncbi:conserved hypothetical protein [sediment metagenome]|uniref:Squalene cyclase C-terminal domain-containing protein n=1 Tax=sediment metagenome TaxID=749907 RepID=D9PI86_9ZZZZ